MLAGALAGALITLSASAAPAYGAAAQTFVAPAPAPSVESSTYVGKSNSTLQNGPVVPGVSFDRFVQIWFENTDFASCMSSPTFQNISSQGVLLSGYHGVTHPSEPNYIAAIGGDFFGLHDDAFYAIPSNASTIVDLLEAKNISWASYQENMPYDGYSGFNYTESNYVSGSGEYTYYVRKHDATAIFNSIEGVESRAMRRRNMNDFAADLNASAIPQWSFITPNLVNDGHDTDVDFMSAYLQYFLQPLLDNPSFNDNRTLILLTFDENETYEENNRVFTVALGGAVPRDLIGTEDNTYYTHYSTLSTVEANWALGSLGRGDTNATMNNVFTWVADATNFTNNGLTLNSTDLPLTNLTGIFPGPLHEAMWTPVLAPNVSAVGAGGGAVFVADSVDTSLTSYTPQNLTAMGVSNPESTNPGYDYSTGSLVVSNSSSAASGTSSGSSSSSSGSGSGSGGANAAVGVSVTLSTVVAAAGLAAGAVLAL